MKKRNTVVSAGMVLLTICLMISACSSSLELKKVDYSYKLESVQQPGPDGVISDQRHGIEFNILPLQHAELKDSSSVKVKQVHYIRNAKGYYFITADQFRNVYVMKPDEGSLLLEKKIQVHEKGLDQPAFNWRSPYVELLHSDNDNALKLTENGIIKDMGEKES